MAAILINDFDTFKLDAGATVQISHVFAVMARRLASQELEVNKRATGIASINFGMKVPLIQFVRGTFKDSRNGTLGLKDAKDVLDHYYATCE